MASATSQRTDAIKEYALGLGFPVVGFSPAGAVSQAAQLDLWLARGFHASMAFMATSRDKRLDPTRVLPGAKSVISLAMPYRHKRPEHSGSGPVGKVSCYAWGRDYHRVIGRKLSKIKEKLVSESPGAEVYYEVDTGPVMERYWACRSGIGWIGKNSSLIVPGFGSFVFLSAIITNVEFDYGKPIAENCGGCDLCLKACPTGAIVEPGVIDCNRCISYLTVEHRGGIPEFVRKRMSPWVFGCDTCQEACPWNKEVPYSEEPEFGPRPGIADPDLERLAGLSQEDFARRFYGTPVKRAGLDGLRRNARSILESAETDKDPGFGP